MLRTTDANLDSMFVENKQVIVQIFWRNMARPTLHPSVQLLLVTIHMSKEVHPNAIRTSASSTSILALHTFLQRWI